MRTFILAWVIGFLGLVMIVGGIWGVIDLYRQEVRAPLKSYGGAISMICGGVVGRDAGAAYTARRFLLHGNARMTLARSLSSRAWTKAQGNDEASPCTSQMACQSHPTQHTLIYGDSVHSLIACA